MFVSLIDYRRPCREGSFSSSSSSEAPSSSVTSVCTGAGSVMFVVLIDYRDPVGRVVSAAVVEVRHPHQV